MGIRETGLEAAESAISNRLVTESKRVDELHRHAIMTWGSLLDREAPRDPKTIKRITADPLNTHRISYTAFSVAFGAHRAAWGQLRKNPQNLKATQDFAYLAQEALNLKRLANESYEKLTRIEDERRYLVDPHGATCKQIAYILSLAGVEHLSQTGIPMTWSEAQGRMSKGRASAIIDELLTDEGIDGM